MIFYGTNSSRLKDGQLPNVTCPNCKNQTSMTYTVFGKYANYSDYIDGYTKEEIVSLYNEKSIYNIDRN